MTPSRSVAPLWVSVWWAVVGGLVAFGVAGLATIGLFLLAGAGVLGAVGLAVPVLRRPCLPGFLVGLSVAPLYIAWLNRGGPGRVCQSTSTSMACTDAWSPWPFVAVGLLFAGVGLALLVLDRRQGDRRPGLPAGAAGHATRT